MWLWRLSGKQHAEAFDGGYGLVFEGRWNTVGRPVTYCATSPSLCVLEKLVHIEDPALLPELVLVTYAVPDTLAVDVRSLDDLPPDWREREALTQQLGNAWLDGLGAALLSVPSAVVPVADSPDQNLLVNHRHPEVGGITISRQMLFELDMRLFT